MFEPEIPENLAAFRRCRRRQWWAALAFPLGLLVVWAVAIAAMNLLDVADPTWDRVLRIITALGFVALGTWIAFWEVRKTLIFTKDLRERRMRANST